MTHRRNTAGLKRSAAERQAETRRRAEAGIRQLVAAGRPVTFEAVRAASGVSRAWLYRHLKERIMHLRAQAAGASPAPATRASAASKEAIIATLRQRVKQLEAENRALRDQLEVAYGQLAQRPESAG